MTSSILERIDPAALTLRLDQITAVVPCLAFVLCLNWTDEPSAIQEFHDQALDSLGGLITHYRAERMGGRKSVSNKARSLLRGWLEKPVIGKAYYLEFYGCDDDHGISSAGMAIHLNLRSRRNKPFTAHENWMASWKRLHESGQLKGPLLPCTLLRISVPLDHALAEPRALAAWIDHLTLVKSGPFASGYAGYALNYYESVVSEAIRTLMIQRLAALCLRYPGLDWHNAYYIIDKLLPYIPSINDFLPLLKRVNWLNLISEGAIAHLGGVERIHNQLGANPAIQIKPTGSGVMIQAGEMPQLGDATKNDFVDPYRAVARVLRPIRIKNISGPGSGFSDDKAQEWLEAFDAEVR